MVKITATREIKYAGKTRLPGESFDASEKDAKIYVAIKRATYGDNLTARPIPAMIASMTAPEPVAAPEEEAAPAAPAHPQTYARRDMVAEPGQTGQSRPSPSSPRGRRPKASI